jgi:hypothetical protein
VASWLPRLVSVTRKVTLPGRLTYGSPSASNASSTDWPASSSLARSAGDPGG